MSLETASYVANLIVTNPDGSDARSTADDHLRLIKAVLRRTFPNMDSAVSLSAIQVSYVGDLSASAQLQLNQLRDGSATANNALYANSASVAAFIGSIPAARVPDLAGALNTFSAAGGVVRFTGDGFAVQWVVGGNSLGYITGSVANGMYLLSAFNAQMLIGRFGVSNLTFNSDGTITVNGLLSGTITNAQTATTATTATSATTATTATSASTATFASTCTSASSAATLGGLAGDATVAASTVALRNGAGDLFVRYLNQNSGAETVSVGHIVCVSNNVDGYHRIVPVASVGPYMETINITTKTGTKKTLASGSGPPSLVGSTNGDLFYYY